MHAENIFNEPPPNMELLLGKVGRYRAVSLKDGKIWLSTINEAGVTERSGDRGTLKQVCLIPAQVRTFIKGLMDHFDDYLVPRLSFRVVLGQVNETRRLKFVGGYYQRKYLLQFRIFYRSHVPTSDDIDDDHPSQEGVTYERSFFFNTVRYILDGYERQMLPQDPLAAKKLKDEVRAVLAINPFDVLNGGGEAAEEAVVPKGYETIRAILLNRMEEEPGRLIGENIYREHFRDLLVLICGRILEFRLEQMNKNDDDLYQL